MPHLDDFPHVRQEQDYWCWAAVAVAVCRYYRTTRTQCDVVNQQFQRADCCRAPDSTPCNRPGFLDAALADNGILDNAVAGAIPLAALISEISLGRPVPIHYTWRGLNAGAHVFTVVGAETNGSIIVDDPLEPAETETDYQSLLSNYDGNPGQWTFSYRLTALPRRPPYFDAPGMGLITSKGLADVFPLLRENAIIVSSMSEQMNIRIVDLSLGEVASGAELGSAHQTGLTARFQLSSDRRMLGIRNAKSSVPMMRDLENDVALQRVASASAADFANFELLRIPGLHIRALWDRSAGLVYPLSPRPMFLGGDRYTTETFEQLTRYQAERLVEVYRDAEPGLSS